MQSAFEGKPDADPRVIANPRPQTASLLRNVGLVALLMAGGVALYCLVQPVSAVLIDSWLMLMAWFHP